VSSIRDADVSSILGSVTFEAEGTNADWLKIGAPSASGDEKTATVRAQPPSEDAELRDDDTATVLVTAVIREVKDTRRVHLSLITYEVRFTPV